MKALVGTFNKEKALVGTFLVNVNFSRSFVYPSFQALVRSCHHDNHAILTGGSGSGDVSPLPFHLLVNSFSSHIIHSIQILNVSTGPIFLPMVLNAHWKVSKKWRIEGNRGEGFDNNTVLLVGDLKILSGWQLQESRVPDLMFVMSTSVFPMWGREAGELWALAKPPNVSNWFPAPSSVLGPAPARL